MRQLTRIPKPRIYEGPRPPIPRKHCRCREGLTCVVHRIFVPEEHDPNCACPVDSKVLEHAQRPIRCSSDYDFAHSR